MPQDVRFAVNGFRAYTGSLMVGSDAGWWLPYYTKRESVLPPILYATERMPVDFDRQALLDFEIDVRASNGEPALLYPPLCRSSVTHLFLGERQGDVGFDATPLFPMDWLSANQAFQRLYQEDNAQVWQFNREICTD